MLVTCVDDNVALLILFNTKTTGRELRYDDVRAKRVIIRKQTKTIPTRRTRGRRKRDIIIIIIIIISRADVIVVARAHWYANPSAYILICCVDYHIYFSQQWFSSHESSQLAARAPSLYGTIIIIRWKKKTWRSSYY